MSEVAFYNNTGVVRRLNALRFASVSYDLRREWGLWFRMESLYGVSTALIVGYGGALVLLTFFGDGSVPSLVSVGLLTAVVYVLRRVTYSMFENYTFYYELWGDVIYSEMGRYSYETNEDYETVIDSMISFLRQRLIRGYDDGSETVPIVEWEFEGELFEVFYDTAVEDFIVKTETEQDLPTIAELEEMWAEYDDEDDEDWDSTFFDDDEGKEGK